MTPPPAATAAPTAPPDRAWAKALVFLSVAVAAGLAAASALSVGSGSKSAAVLPVAAGVGLALAVLALTRFQVYVMVMLVLRSSLDLAKLSGRAAGNASTSTAARALDPSSLLAVLFLLAAALWLAAQYRRHRSLPGSPLRRALVVFLAAAVLSIIGSARPEVSALEAMRIAAVVVMFVVLEQMMIDPRKMRQILTAAFLSTVIPLAYTAFGFLVGSPPAEQKGSFTRIVGTFNQSNEFGRYLMLMLIMGAAVYPHLDRTRRRALGLAMVAMSVFLVLTYTRSALLATALGLFVVGRVQSKRLIRGLLVVGVAAVVLVPSLAARFTDLTRFEARQEALRGPTHGGNTLAWRLGYWTQVLPLANRNPLTGIGLRMTQHQTDKAKQPHNDFIRAYVETGVVGLLAYLSVIVALVALGRRAVRVAPKHSLDRGVAAGFLGCAVAFVAVSLVANVMSNVVNLWYLAAFAAAASAVVRRHGPPRPGRGGREERPSPPDAGEEPPAAIRRYRLVG